MQRTISLKLEKSPELLDTIFVYNQIVNLHIKESFVLKTNSKKKLHNSIYKTIREQFPSFPSALIQCARDNCVEMLKSNKYNEHTVKKDVSSIRFDLRTIKVFLTSSKVSITTNSGRKKYSIFVPTYFNIYKTWKVKGATLGVSHKFLKLKIIVETNNFAFCNNREVLGIDLGIKNYVVLSNNTFIKAKKLKRIKRKYQYLRSKLQSKGTCSAKKRLKLLAGRERRFQLDFNHCLAKQITNMPYGIFAIEELTGIKNKNSCKSFNRQRSNWTYSQIKSFIFYKAEQLGKVIMIVDSRYTSQKCSKCGFINKANRKGSVFCCLSCDFVCHSDLNASYNISQVGKFLFEQVDVNQPKVTTNEEVSSLQNKTSNVSCKLSKVSQ